MIATAVGIELRPVSLPEAATLWQTLVDSLEEPAAYYGPEWVNRHPREDHRYYAVLDLMGGQIVGLGWTWLLSPTTAARGTGLWARDQGIGPRFSLALTEQAFEDFPGAGKVESEIYSSNPRSLTMALTLGYWTVEGTQRQTIMVRGAPYDRVLLGVTRPEWEAYVQAGRWRRWTGAQVPA